MKWFNAFQTTCLFAGGPFGIDWLDHATFTGAGAAYWVALAAYLVGFVVMVTGIRSLMDHGF